MDAVQLPERYQALDKVSDIVANWCVIEHAIRPEYVGDRNLQKAKIALDVNLNDAAINYFWNLTIHDLHRKIVTYGIEYFSSAINWSGKQLTNIEDLREVNDNDIINGCHILSILQDESCFYLHKCREIRNCFSTAHYPIGEIDILETFNFIKNCIKYTLTHDLPAPGIQIKALMERLAVDKLDNIDSIVLQINQQAQKVRGPILHSLFKQFIKPNCDGNSKHNIKLLAPIVWKDVDDEVKTAIAQKYTSLKEVKDNETEAEALVFLKLVDGVSYIPEDYKDILFSKASKALIDAHFEINNFYTEPNLALDLCALGSVVPTRSLRRYVKSIILSFVGNYYGVANGAVEYNEKMVSKWSTIAVYQFFDIVIRDKDVVGQLIYPKPIARLKLLLKLIENKTIATEHQSMFEYLSNNNDYVLLKHFNDEYIRILSPN